MSAAAQHAALCCEERERKEARRAHRHQRGSPAEDVAQSVTNDGRKRITEAAADTVRAICVAEAARSDAGIEDRKIGRMEDPVADAHESS